MYNEHKKSIVVMAFCLLFALSVALIQQGQALDTDRLKNLASDCLIGNLLCLSTTIASQYLAAIGYLFTKHSEDTISSFNKLKGRTYS